MAAGKIAGELEIPHNTLSSHLAILLNAGLVNSRREGRSIIYSINFDGTRELLSFLMEDCCQGHPELCAPVLDSVLSGCCAKPLPGEMRHEDECRSLDRLANVAHLVAREERARCGGVEGRSDRFKTE